MDYKEIQHKGVEELQTMAQELRSKLLQLRFNLAEKRLKDVSQIKKTKIELARVLTALEVQK